MLSLKKVHILTYFTFGSNIWNNCGANTFFYCTALLMLLQNETILYVHSFTAVTVVVIVVIFVVAIVTFSVFYLLHFTSVHDCLHTKLLMPPTR